MQLVTGQAEDVVGSSPTLPTCASIYSSLGNSPKCKCFTFDYKVGSEKIAQKCLGLGSSVVEHTTENRGVGSPILPPGICVQ